MLLLLCEVVVFTNLSLVELVVISLIFFLFLFLEGINILVYIFIKIFSLVSTYYAHIIPRSSSSSNPLLAI